MNGMGLRSSSSSDPIVYLVVASAIRIAVVAVDDGCLLRIFVGRSKIVGYIIVEHAPEGRTDIARCQQQKGE